MISITTISLESNIAGEEALCIDKLNVWVPSAMSSSISDTDEQACDWSTGIVTVISKLKSAELAVQKKMVQTGESSLAKNMYEYLSHCITYTNTHLVCFHRGHTSVWHLRDTLSHQEHLEWCWHTHQWMLPLNQTEWSQRQQGQGSHLWEEGEGI